MSPTGSVTSGYPAEDPVLETRTEQGSRCIDRVLDHGQLETREASIRHWRKVVGRICSKQHIPVHQPVLQSSVGCGDVPVLLILDFILHHVIWHL
jgi:hypothetical protein